MNLTKRTRTVSLLTLVFGLALNGYSQSFLTNGLVAYYPFNGNANDASGNGHNGTVYGATLASNRLNFAGNAYYFNGTNNDIETPDSPQFETGRFTLSLWVKASSWVTRNLPPAGPYVELLNKDGLLTGQRQWVIQGKNSGQIRAAVFTSVGENRYDTSTVLKLGIWHHVVEVWDGTTLAVFINGILDGSVLASGTLASGNAPVRIGGSPESADYFWGNIDDVRIFSRALSATEVQQLYVYESGPRVDLIKAVKPSFSNLTMGTNYQLQVSGNLIAWTNQGSAFTATNINMVYPQYWDVANWNGLYFRLQATP